MAGGLTLYLVLMIMLGPGTALLGLYRAVIGRVPLTHNKQLVGRSAVVAGLGTSLLGVAVTYFFWSMMRFFPP